MSTLDLVLFSVYVAVIVAIGLWSGRREETAEDYFLAGRSLPWWLIGASLLASNISTEHFVGMAGAGADVGLAIASYEWMAAITLLIVARWFLPRFLEDRIGTMPEYLERRFGSAARSLLAVYMLLAYVGVALAVVLYSGALAMDEMFDLPLGWGIALLAVVGGVYTVAGGLKAVVWTDLLQAFLLLGGGGVALWLALEEVGGFGALRAAAPDKFHMVLPLDHADLPWFAVFFGGLWIANLFYWGCNQFITQRALAARNLRQARYGLLFAAALKLVIPFVIVVPGIAAAVIYGDQLEDPDRAYPMLLERLLPAGLRGLMFAALMGAVLSSLDSMLNSASTIFTLDVYKRHLRPDAGHRGLIRVGRATTVVCLVGAAAWAPWLGRFEGVFEYIQEFWGLITPGVAVVFLCGLFWRRTSAQGATAALAATLPVTLGVKLVTPGWAFLDQMFAAALLLLGVVVALSLGRAPARAPALGPREANRLSWETRRDPLFDALAWVVVAATVALYVIFF